MKKFLINKKSGFTIVEILIVVIIIGLLLAAIGLSLQNTRRKSRDSRRVSDLKEIVKSIELYNTENHSFPYISSGTGNCIGIGDGEIDSFLLPYLNPVPIDPRQTQYADVADCGKVANTSDDYYYYYDRWHICSNELTSATLHIQTLETSALSNQNEVCPVNEAGNHGNFVSADYVYAFDEIAIR